MDKDYLILKRASASRRSGKWKDADFDVLADGVVVGRIFNSAASPVGLPWMWTYGFSAATQQRARRPWRRSRKAGDANSGIERPGRHDGPYQRATAHRRRNRGSVAYQ